jgi:hypothetical protein
VCRDGDGRERGGRRRSDGIAMGETTGPTKFTMETIGQTHFPENGKPLARNSFTMYIFTRLPKHREGVSGNHLPPGHGARKLACIREKDHLHNIVF